MKTRYIHKSMRDIDTKERASQLADKQGAPAEVGKSLSKSTGKRRKGIARARANLERPIKESSLQEKSAAEVLKKRYASYHADDNPQATRKLKPSEHDQPKGANVYKMHPGVKLTDRGYSKKGKMAALKKQHARRPEQYGITKEEMRLEQREIISSLMELSPKTISSYQKKAGAQYRDLKKSTMSATSREGGYHKGYISDKEYDAQHQMADKKARRGKGLAMSAGKGVKKEEVQQVDELKKSTLGSYIKRATGDAISRSHSSQFNLQRGVEARDKGDKKGAKAHFKKSEKESKKTMDRFHGINRAAGKLTPGKDKDEYLADKNPVKVGGYKTFKQKHSSNVKATNESLNKLIGQAVDKIEAASDKVKKKVKIKNALIKNPSTY